MYYAIGAAVGMRVLFRAAMRAALKDSLKKMDPAKRAEFVENMRVASSPRQIKRLENMVARIEG